MMVPLLPCLLLLLASDSASDLETETRRFAEFFAAVESQAADPIIPEKALYDGAIPGMLRRLDPHSVFLNPDQFEQLKQLKDSKSKGFGTVVSVLPGRVIILQTLAGTASAKAGLAPGDEIIAVNGIQLSRLGIEQLIGLLSESRQRPVNMDVRRPGSVRTLQFVLKPEELQAPSVERVFALRPGVGYIRVASFDEKTGADIGAIEKWAEGLEVQCVIANLADAPPAFGTASRSSNRGRLFAGRAGRSRRQRNRCRRKLSRTRCPL